MPHGSARIQEKLGLMRSNKAEGGGFVPGAGLRAGLALLLLPLQGEVGGVPRWWCGCPPALPAAPLGRSVSVLRVGRLARGLLLRLPGGDGRILAEDFG